MKILQVHNYYQNPTGDDAVLKEEHDLLIKNGHEVIQFTKTNKVLSQSGLISKLKTAKSLKSSKSVGHEFSIFLAKHKPDIVHAHNIYPLITPVVFEVCHKHRIPVIQTLHNYRLSCVNTLLYRDGNICEDCITHGLNQGVKHKCYNNSRIQSYIMADTLKYHRKRDTWNKKVGMFICLSEFAKAKFMDIGIKAEKLIVKSNFIRDPRNTSTYEDFFLFAGKLEEQKGLSDFLRLAEIRPEVKFKVAGFCDDPSIFSGLENVEYLGQLEREELMKLMQSTKGLLFLSKMFEGMPMTILEAFVHKKAVIARNLGAMSEMINPGFNGELFDGFDQLCDSVDKFESTNYCKVLGNNAYSDYLERYDQESAYKSLMSVYDRLID